MAKVVIDKRYKICLILCIIGFTMIILGLLAKICELTNDYNELKKQSFEIKEENEMMWKYRDSLCDYYGKQEL